MNSDLLDEYCASMFNHTDWEIDFDVNGNVIIKFFKKPREEYVLNNEE
jgi:hypothetical protein